MKENKSYEQICKKRNIVVDTKTNKKMYPVGKWITYSHVFYNYDDICYNDMMDTQTEVSCRKFEESQYLLNCFETNPRVNGVVYVYYEDYKL